MLADQLEYVIGVDPHRDRHALAVVRAPSGEVVYETDVVASTGGYQAALETARVHAPGPRVFAVEGSGSYGRGLSRFLSGSGERVVEVSRVRRDRRGGKTDALDAVRAARGVLADRKSAAAPRAGGRREALRALLVARQGGQAAKRAALNQLRALIVTCPEPLRAELSELSRARLLTRLSAARPAARRDPELRGTLIALRTIAGRIHYLTRDERQLTREIEQLVQELAPDLLTEAGVGPICAAQAIVAYSHHGRLRDEAAFARLAGTAPIPAASGLNNRHRLDRGGDRQLNQALHTILVNRRRIHQPTRDYIARRTSEGKTTREAIRCLKRYLARHLYRQLTKAPMPT